MTSCVVVGLFACAGCVVIGFGLVILQDIFLWKPPANGGRDALQDWSWKRYRRDV